MTQYKIAILLGLARVIGKLLGCMKRNQTRLLSRAQFHGWEPEGDDANERLARDQFHLYLWRRARAEHKQKRWEARTKV